MMAKLHGEVFPARFLRVQFRAVAVAMGITYEEMVALFVADSAIKRMNTVEEVAAVAVMLASEAARNFQGCMFPVDGGTLPY